MEQGIYELVEKNKERILALWQAAVLPQGGGLLSASSQKNSAPADRVLSKELHDLFDWLLSAKDVAEARMSLDEMCKIKAVQALTPSEALGFIIDLKGIIRLVLNDEEPSSNDRCVYDEIDKRIDQLMLLAVDEYFHCREQIMEIKVNEIRRLAGKSMS